MIRIRTGSRLHFGPLNLGGISAARDFGGVGMMIDGPGIILEATPANTWAAEGHLAKRVHVLIDRLKRNGQEPMRITVGVAGPEHVGLGSGTQLALAVARALDASGNVFELAGRVGRGGRSAIGIHGFERGGFLVDGGKAQDNAIAPLIARLEFPEDWRVVVMHATESQGKHGISEKDAFSELKKRGANDAEADRRCRLVLLEMLPALVDRDLNCFGEALFKYNRLAGEVFSAVQGGRYASPAVEDIVNFTRQSAIRGVGQSSWGPAVFAVIGDQEEAAVFAERMRSRFNGLTVHLCRGLNRGAEVKVAEGGA